MLIRTGYSGKRGGVPSPCALRHRSGCNSARHGAASTGRPHGANSGGDGVPPAYRHDVALQVHEKAFRGCSQPPFEGVAR
jgi:hypothetical protein